jgi:shikimate kinase
VKGRGRGASAISFLNGLFTGDGSAAGIELFAYAEVELRPDLAPPGAAGFAADRPSLVDATAVAALRAWSTERWAATITVRSDVPAGCGLKSSSAVSSAVEHAILDALRVKVPPVDVARLWARTALAGGFSATGAFDDALASVLPGIHVTSNPEMRSLHQAPVPGGLEVVLWVPGQRHLPSPAYRTRFAAARPDAAEARAAAARGDWQRAMALNSALVERTMGYDYAALREGVASAGAVAAGVSGMGPAFAAITPPDRLGAVLRAFPPGKGEVILTRFLARPTGGAP